MKRYEKYKDSGIVWIGEIPSHWNIIKIKRLSHVKRGASPRPIDDLKFFDENGEFSWVRISDLTASERYLLRTEEKLSELGASLSVKRYPGDFFLSIAGSVGKPIITKIKCCIHDGFVWFPDLKINPEYLYYLFQSGLPFGGLGKLGTQLNLNTETIGNIYIPDLTYQDINKIVQYLDHQTSIIDQLIQQKEKLIELLKEKRQAVIDTSVTKGINSNVSLKETKIKWLKLIPEHWKISAIKNILEIPITDGPHTTPDLFDEGVPFISAESIKNGKIDFDKKRGYISQKDYELFSKKYVPKIKDIYMVKSGATTGNVAMVETNKKFTIWSPLAVFRADESKVLPEYLHYYLQSQSLRSAVEISWSYGTQQNIGMGVLANISIPYPSIKEQKEILFFLDLSLKKIDQLESPIKDVIEKLKEYRQSIISEAVTGKIDVRDWQPNKQQVA
ncbi:MAG: restriction endonuclease subunit S [Chitinophagaceae bacterium]|nr:restriction endonuclease subunit S [Chitinophagaceae bacterium]